MPYGLKTAPIKFQRVINNLFSDMIGNCVYGYLVDLLVCDKDAETHLVKLEAVLLNMKDVSLIAKLG